MEAATVRGSRYPAVDALRGFALVHMVCYHAVWDLVNLHGLDLPWYDGWPGFLWQQFICWSFIIDNNSIILLIKVDYRLCINCSNVLLCFIHSTCNSIHIVENIFVTEHVCIFKYTLFHLICNTVK